MVVNLEYDCPEHSFDHKSTGAQVTLVTILITGRLSICNTLLYDQSSIYDTLLIADWRMENIHNYKPFIHNLRYNAPGKLTIRSICST